MPAKRCFIDNIDWPDDERYNVCPACLLETHRFANVKALSEQEAHVLASNFAFDRFYADYDETEDPERLSPRNDPAILDKYGQAYLDAKIAERRKPVARRRTPSAAVAR